MLATHYLMGEPLTVALLGLDQVSPQYVVARFRLTNTQSGGGVETAAIGGNSWADTALIDPASGTEYLSLTTQDGSGCVCTRVTGDRATQDIWPGSLNVDIAFPAPAASTSKMIVVFPNTPPFLDVPLQTTGHYSLPQYASTLLRPQRTAAPGYDPVSTEHKPPVTLRIVNLVQNADANVATSGGQEQERLSSDVLFAVNKAVLSAKANTILRQTAARIDASRGSTVQVDGYTDSTGNDAINIPLSRRRAASVTAALRHLVTRSGVTFASAGHGAADPVASNNTVTGRSLNRRVSVTFSEPAPPAPSQVPAAAADPAQQRPSPVVTTVTSTSSTSPEPGQGWAPGIKAQVNGLIRDPSGYAELTWTIDATHAGTNIVGSVWSDFDNYNSGWNTGAISLTAGASTYRNIMNSNRNGIFTLFSQLATNATMSGSQTFWNLFLLPPNVTAVNITIPGFPKLTNVPVQSAPAIG